MLGRDERLFLQGMEGLLLSEGSLQRPDARLLRRAPERGRDQYRRDDYDPDDVARWARIVSDQEWEDAFVFFKHEDAGAGPALAERFVAELG
jgi:uncharacterized protein YecE (DUF72 family)